MKNKLSVVVVLTLCLGISATPGFSQNKVTGGVKGGVNLATLSIDPEDDGCCSTRVGGAVGAFLNAGINDIASLQPEFLYAMEGAKGTGGEEGLKININAVEIPLLVRAKLTRNDRIHPFVVAGPAVVFRTSAKIKLGDQEEDLGDEVKKAGAGLVFGGGIAAGPATIEARYNLGLTNWSKDSDSAKVRSFSILLGYQFGK